MVLRVYLMRASAFFHVSNLTSSILSTYIEGHGHRFKTTHLIENKINILLRIEVFLLGIN